MTETRTDVTDPEAKSVAESVLQGAATVAWIAAPDWITTVRQRRVVRGAALAVMGATAATQVVRTRAAAPAEEPDDVLEEDAELEDDEREDDDGKGSRWFGPVLGGAVVVVGLGAAYGVHRGAEWLTERGVEALRRRGVHRPWTVVGLGWGALSVGLDLVERRTFGEPA